MLFVLRFYWYLDNWTEIAPTERNLMYRRISTILVDILALPTFLLALILIYVKNSKDVLQGINKLDNLLKVSIFQRYKPQVAYRYIDGGESRRSSTATEIKDTIMSERYNTVMHDKHTQRKASQMRSKSINDERQFSLNSIEVKEDPTGL